MYALNYEIHNTDVSNMVFMIKTCVLKKKSARDSLCRSLPPSHFSKRGKPKLE